MICAAASPGLMYSVSTAVMPSGWRVTRAVVNWAVMKSIVSGRIAIARYLGSECQRAMNNFPATLRQLASVVALCVAASAGAAEPIVMPMPVQGLPAQARGALIFDGVPAIDPNLAARITDYLVGRDESFAAWLPDDSLLISTRFADVSQVHRVIAPLGMREQLTWYADPVTKVLTSPTGAADGFAFLKEHNADDQPQLYYYSFATHGARMLSGGSGRHGSPLWSPDGQHLVFTGNDRAAAITDIY